MFTVGNVSLLISGLNTLYVIILEIMLISTYEEDNYLKAIVEILASFSFVVISQSITMMRTSSTILIEVLLVTLTLGSLLYSKRLHKKYVEGNKYERVDLDGKVYIVTGSNAGIGFETAKAIVAMNGTVVMACRSVEKANHARMKIINATKCSPSKIIVIKLDLCGFDSVRKFVKEFRSLGLPLHGLVNNAGIMMAERSLTQDGFEIVITANHLSHFLLTNLLLPDLEKTSGRVVVVSSTLHKLLDKFHFDNLMGEKHYSLFGQYGQSKLANILFTFELQRRLSARNSKISCHVIHPGIVHTEVTKNMGFFMRFGEQLAMPLMMILRKSPEQGAYCTMHALIAPLTTLRYEDEVYLIHGKPTIPSAAARDRKQAEELWVLSEKLTGIGSQRS